MCQWHSEVSFQKHICWPLTPSLLVLSKGPFWKDGQKEAKVAQLGFLLIKWDGSRLRMKETIFMEEDGKSLLMEHWMRTIPSHAPGEIKQADQVGTGAPEGWKCSSWSNTAGVRQPGCEFQPYYLPGADYLPCCCSAAKLSDFLQPHGLQYTRLSCPLPSPTSRSLLKLMIESVMFLLWCCPYLLISRMKM